MNLTRGVLEAMQHEMRVELPNEACGVLSGPVPNCATTIHHAPNRKHSPDSFRIGLLDRLRIYWRIYRMQEQPVATWHSHPRGTLTLSEADRRALGRVGMVGIILTPDGGVAAYNSQGKRVEIAFVG